MRISPVCFRQDLLTAFVYDGKINTKSRKNRTKKSKKRKKKSEVDIPSHFFLRFTLYIFKYFARKMTYLQKKKKKSSYIMIKITAN